MKPASRKRVECCKFCGREMTEEIWAWKRKVKADNGRLSLAKARANGSRIGRKKIRNDEQIRELREQGLTMRAIAAKIGLSTMVVQRALKGPR